LWCGNVLHDQFIQVTPSGVRLIDSFTKELITQWTSPYGAINVTAANPSQIVVATGENTITYLEVAEGIVIEKGQCKIDAEIACIDISPLGVYGLE
jgi:DNA damage-binding protein 1